MTKDKTRNQAESKIEGYKILGGVLDEATDFKPTLPKEVDPASLPYVRNKKEGILTMACGSHCGVVTVGQATQHVGHCPGPCCHDGGDPALSDRIVDHFLNQPGGIQIDTIS